MPVMEPQAKQSLSRIYSSGPLETPRHSSDQSHAVGFLPFPASQGEAKPDSARWKPATLALVLQLSALLITLTLLVLIDQYAPMEINFLTVAAFQGCVAMLLSIVFRMDVWWRVIQFTFPVGLLTMHHLALPTWFYFLGFMFTLSLFWTTFRTQVPFYPSRPDVWHRVAECLPEDRQIHLIDIGSGLGDLVMHLARCKPDSHFSGIEIAPLPWLVSRMRTKSRGIANAGFALGNYEALDFAQFDVVFAYLSPVAMTALWQKASREMKPGSSLMSYEFEIPGIKPDDILFSPSKPSIYVWHF